MDWFEVLHLVADDGQTWQMRDYGQHDDSMFRVYDGRDPWFPDLNDGAFLEAGLLKQIRDDFRGRSVLEVACGGGYWANFLQDVALAYTGIDASPRRIAFARERVKWSMAAFHVASAYDLQQVPGKFDAGLAVAWFSHVPTERRDAFLSGLHKRLGAGAVVYLIDEAANDPNAFQKPGGLDHYKRVKSSDGTFDDIVDNAFSEDDYRRLFSGGVGDLQIGRSQTWTWVRYVIVDARFEFQ